MSGPRTKEQRAAFEKEHGRDTRSDLLNLVWDLEGAVNRNGEEMVAIVEKNAKLIEVLKQSRAAMDLALDSESPHDGWEPADALLAALEEIRNLLGD
jgi:hypothetical protein